MAQIWFVMGMLSVDGYFLGLVALTADEYAARGIVYAYALQVEVFNGCVGSVFAQYVVNTGCAEVAGLYRSGVDNNTCGFVGDIYYTVDIVCLNV